MTSAENGNRNDTVDSGLEALCGIAAYLRLTANASSLKRELAISGQSNWQDLQRACRIIQLKGKVVLLKDADRMLTIPAPAIMRARSGNFLVFGGVLPNGMMRVVDPVRRTDVLFSADDLYAQIDPQMLLLKRQRNGPGVTPRPFGFEWFIPFLLKYRKPFLHVIIASVVLQIFSLVTPLFFQIIIDKVLAHQSYDTLYVVGTGMIMVTIFECILQFLRTYALSHTTNRIDVELGKRLFHHLLALPLSFFEANAAGQTVARVRELENIRNFLTGQALFAAMDTVFSIVLIVVMFIYSWQLSLIVLASVPFYILIAAVLRPILRRSIERKFAAGAQSNQFLVESIVGVQTIKAGAVEPATRLHWEETLSTYVHSAFGATIVAAGGQGAIQFVVKASAMVVLFMGAQAVMAGDLSIGQLIAFNMISSLVTQPVLRLSQLWQDFQQMQVSVARLGDILDRRVEHVPQSAFSSGRPRGDLELKSISFSYQPGGAPVLKDVSMKIAGGETIGIVGPSGSGKSTLTKLLQRLYVPTGGQALIDGIDLMQVDPGWLRSNIGVVLQENLLFNRTIHDNIALANPSLPRAAVIEAAKLAGAHDFVMQMEGGYDKMIEERGSNLSGGQRQRLAIARALVTNPPVLILDEATSALDYESERIIQNNMALISKGRTVIIIAHRLTAVRRCNRIYGMEDGRIVEVGTHDQLLSTKGGLYKRLWDLQNGEL